MKLPKKISVSLFMFIFTFFFFSIVGVAGSLSCCYQTDSGVLHLSSSCQVGEIRLGDADFNYDKTDGCKVFESSRRGYEINGVCYATYMGKEIYDNADVLNSFDASFDKTKLVPYSDSICSGSSSGVSGTVDSSTISSSSSTIGNSGTSTIGDLNEINISFDQTVNIEENRVFCKDAGSPLGFFVSKDSCNNFRDSNGNQICVYNPYLAGYFSTEFINDEEENLNFDLFETGCVPKIAITKCIDYKTRENCKNLGAEMSCAWVDSSVYSPISGFNSENGLCLSTKVSHSKFYNFNEYVYRGNVVKNPSFEDGFENWFKISNSNPIVMVGNTFHGKSYLKIPSGNAIFQELEGIGAKITYSSFLYLKANNFDDNAKIELELIPIDVSGNVIDDEKFSQSITLKDIYQDNIGNYFKKVVFNQVTFSSDIAVLYFKISAVGTEIDIDAVDFQPTLKDNDAKVNEMIFNPVEIISEGASNCNLCFDETNFNFCTKIKSNLLGDCSYLVNGPDEKYESELDAYLGKDSNIYLTEENYTNWKAQSLSNSKMFCEMYVRKEQCEDPNNYVNSKYSKLHYGTERLCKWDSIHGCFKDSDNDGFPDVRQNLVLLRAQQQTTKDVFKSFNAYVYERNETFPTSDFDLSCDVIPPNSYIYFKAKDPSGNDIIINNNFANLNFPIGNIYVYVYASDYLSDACDDYNISNKLYIDYNVSGNVGYREFTSNQLEESAPITEYFRDDSGSFISDGNNLISVIIKDQSGNVEIPSTFNIYADVSGPEINLISPQSTELSENFWQVDSYITPSLPLNFQISDFSKVKNCSFELEPETEVPEDYYNSSGNFNLTGVTNLKDFFYSFSLPIINSTVDGDVYLLRVICSDVFDQLTVNSYLLNVDFKTDLVLLSPKKYINYTFDDGYLNKPTEFNLVSTDKEMSSCSIEGAQGSLTINSIDEGFETQEYQGIVFYKNITGVLTPNSLGRNEIKIVCQDVNGNTIEKNLVYYYDTEVPVIQDYSLEGPISKVVKIGNDFYSCDRNPGDFLIKVDATKTWLSDKNLSLEVVSPSSDLSFGITPSFFDFNLTEDNMEGDSFKIGSFTSFMDDQVGYFGEPTAEENLFDVRYRLNFSDKAKNPNLEEIHFFYDKSFPSFNFSGEIISQKEGRIYTNKNNPRFVVNFNSPSYRTYTCTVSVSDTSFTYTKSFDSPTNSLSFNLNEISSSLSLSDGENLGISFNCQDIYNKTLSGTFILVYDNTVPELNDLFLGNGNDKYFINRENVAYNDLIDDLVFDLNDTGEEMLDCYYRFTSQSNIYSCNSSWRKAEFVGGESTIVSNLLLLAGTNSNDENAICVRTDAFSTVQAGYISRDQDFISHIYVDGYCKDGVDLSTETLAKDINLHYVSSELVELSFEVIDGVAYPKVKAMVNLDNVVLAYYRDGQDQLLVLNNAGMEDGVYIYTSSSGVSIRDLRSERNLLWGVALSSTGSVISAVSAVLEVDLKAPSVEIVVPDADFENKVYSSRFQINLIVNDLKSGVQEVELFESGRKIFSIDSVTGNITYDNNTIDIPDLNLNSFSNSDRNFNGVVYFKNAVENQQYDFKLRAVDKMANQNETEKLITVGTGVGLMLLNTPENSFTDSTKMFWLTPLESPTITFRTIKTVSSCKIFPFIGEDWVEISGQDSIADLSAQKANDGSNVFSFNLDEFDLFNLDEVDKGERVPIKIVCNFEGIDYNYTRDIIYVDLLPDYVLTSSEGFVLTDSPFTTDIQVKSVGIFSSLICSYAMDSEAYVDFDGGVEKEIFTKRFNFSHYGDGVHTLKIKCYDLLNVYGPEKVYKFIVDKNNNLVISNFTIFRDLDDFEYGKIDGKLSVENKQILDLRFNLNRRKDISCSYIINPVSDSALGFAIDFFRDLFFGERKEMQVGDSPYEFRANNIILNDGENKIRITCSNGESEVREEYLVQTNNQTIGVSTSLELLN